VTHLVIFGLAGQTLRHVVPARVSSATYEITSLRVSQDDPSSRVLASGAATVPAWTLTTDAVAGPSQPNNTRIPVVATAGPAIGETVVLTSSDGAFEGLTVETIETDDYLEANSVLAGTYLAGSTVQSATITAAVPVALYDFEDALDDQRPLRIEWTYTIGGAERRVSEPIQLTRQTHATASTGPAMEYVRERWPGLAVNLGEGQTLEGLARTALERVELDLYKRGEDPAALMLGLQGKLLLAARIVLEAAIGGWSPGMRELDRFIDDARTDYTTQLEAATIGQAGFEAVKMNTDAVAHERHDTTYRSPIGAM
jgi:hypothetical protein